MKRVIRLQSQNDCRDFPESLPSQLHRSDHTCRELRRNRRYYQRNGWIRPPIHHTGHHPVPIVQAPKRAVPSTQTEFFPDFTSHLILRYIRPQVSYQCFAALPISAAQATQTAAAKSAMPSVSHSHESSYRIFMRSSASVRQTGIEISCIPRNLIIVIFYYQISLKPLKTLSLSQVSFPLLFPLYYIVPPVFTNSDKGKYKGKKIL